MSERPIVHWEKVASKWPIQQPRVVRNGRTIQPPLPYRRSGCPHCKRRTLLLSVSEPYLPPPKAWPRSFARIKIACSYSNQSVLKANHSWRSRAGHPKKEWNRKAPTNPRLRLAYAILPKIRKTPGAAKERRRARMRLMRSVKHRAHSALPAWNIRDKALMKGKVKSINWI